MLMQDKHPHSPYPLAHTLSRIYDDSEHRRSRVINWCNKIPCVQKRMLNDIAWVVLMYLGSNKKSTTPTLKALAKHPQDHVRRSVAQNQRAPVTVLETLAHNDNWFVRRGVLLNTSDVARPLHKWLRLEAIKESTIDELHE